VVTLLIFAGLAATLSWQWPHFSEIYRYVDQIVAKLRSSTTKHHAANRDGDIGQPSIGSATRKSHGIDIDVCEALCCT
jgi:hypothetical protein